MLKFFKQLWSSNINNIFDMRTKNFYNVRQNSYIS